MNLFNDVVVLGKATEETKGSNGHSIDPSVLNCSNTVHLGAC